MAKINNITNKSIEKILDGVCDTIQRNKRSIADINGTVCSIGLSVNLVPGELPTISVLKDYLVQRNEDGREVVDFFDVELDDETN